MVQWNPVVGKWNEVGDQDTGPEPYEANGRGKVIAMVLPEADKTVRLVLVKPRRSWVPTFRLAAIRMLEFLLAWVRA